MKNESPVAFEGNTKYSDEEKEQWTTQRLVDELFLCLIDSRGNSNDNLRKYGEQARYLIYRIPIYRPAPSFRISRSDLTDRLVKELESLDRESRKEVLKDAADRIFEGINKRYYLLSVRDLLSVELTE